MASAFGVATLYVQIIVPRVATPVEGMLPAVGYFAMVPVAIGFCLALGFEQAARVGQISE
jgi:hypothetical protein